MAPLPGIGTIDKIYKKFEEKIREHKSYLGMSIIGNPCDRALWYTFHWTSPPEVIDGRKLRLFETGDIEEERIKNNLRSIGVEITNEQSEMSDIGGHFSGHCDGEVLGLEEAPATVHILECKTHNDKSFKDLLKKGVRESKPVHWEQMQTYMHYRNRTRAYYIALNKNDESLYQERVEYDALETMKIINRAKYIIDSAIPLSKLHENPKSKMAFVCGYCNHFGICHDKEFAERNCRTCLFSTPIVDNTVEKKWKCDKHNKFLTKEEQKAGCNFHRYIPELVPGKQIDSDEDAEWIKYEIEGKEWVDNGGI